MTERDPGTARKLLNDENKSPNEPAAAVEAVGETITAKKLIEEGEIDAAAIEPAINFE